MHFEWAQNAGNGVSDFKFAGVCVEGIPTDLPGFSHSVPASQSQVSRKSLEKGVESNIGLNF